MQHQTIQKNTGTPIESIISAYEGVVMGKYNATRVQDMQNPSTIENVYEIFGKGAIFARFAQESAPRFNMHVDGCRAGFADGFVMYLGFDESTSEYKSMISDVLLALDGK